MTHEQKQADYCDALSSGNVPTWDKGCIAILTVDEWIQFEKDKGRRISSEEAVEREGRAVNVADKAIMRMMGNES